MMLSMTDFFFAFFFFSIFFFFFFWSSTYSVSFLLGKQTLYATIHKESTKKIQAKVKERTENSRFTIDLFGFFFFDRSKQATVEMVRNSASHCERFTFYPFFFYKLKSYNPAAANEYVNNYYIINSLLTLFCRLMVLPLLTVVILVVSFNPYFFYRFKSTCGFLTFI